MQDRRKIVAAISGGVDSAVSAARLVGAGHQVVGVFMATHSGPGVKDHMADARRVAEHLGIEFEAMDFTGPMQEIIDLFVQEYSHGRTPNPCIICNARVKFGRLMEFADSIGASGMATGHHVRILQHQGRPMIGRATYLPKDQSYVLFGLDRAKLGRIEFPVGDLTKSQVRAEARQLGLPVHDKPESQEICFISNNDYGAFLLSRRPELNKTGPILDLHGKVIGEHQGAFRYTIGQRRGLRIAAGKPIYVVAIDPTDNTITAGPREALAGRQLWARKLNWHIEEPQEPIRVQAQICYGHKAADATVAVVADDLLEVQFDQDQYAITPGQAVVLYHGDLLLGGGWIERFAK